MNGIIGMLTLAHGQLRGHSAENYIIKAEQLSKYLLSVINDILDMSRIEAGKIELESKPFELAALAEKLRNMFQKNESQRRGILCGNERCRCKIHSWR